MTKEPGTYVLILRSKNRAKVQVGRWGVLDVAKGFYAYIGSAFGPGGVLARVERHCSVAKRNHWHIDYLREALILESVWYSHGMLRLEHVWAGAVSNFNNAQPIARFGCSDCKCQSHLYYFHRRPSLSGFKENMPYDIHSCSCDNAKQYV